MVSSFRWSQKRIKSNVTKRIDHSVFRTAMRKLLWMSQLRDDIKYPVKELSRSLSNPQTRDFIFIMEPQVPAPNSQGLFPVEIVSYSDSDWAGCQKSRRSTSGSLITLFSVNIASTSKLKPHSSAKAELYAMTHEATVAPMTSRAQPRRILQQERRWHHVWACQGSQSILNSSICGFKMFSE